MAQTKTATHVDIHSHIVSHRPHPICTKAWGADKLKKYKSYLKTDARTKDGQTLIASTNGVTAKWDKLTCSYNEDTPIAQKCYDLAYLVAKEGNGFGLRFGMNEGLHRGGAAIQALTGTKIDRITGVIAGPSELSYDDFLGCDLMNEDEVPDDSTFQTVVEKALGGKCHFLETESNVAIKWVSSPIADVSIKTVLDAFQCISKQISDNKLTSARKPSWVQIGDLAKTVLGSVTINSLNHTPNTTGHVFSQTTIATKASANKKINDAKVKLTNQKDEHLVNIQVEAFGIYPFLCEQGFNEYCRDPFNPENEKTVVDHFSFSAMLDEKITLTLPYVNSVKSLLQDPQNKDQLNTWSINAVYLLPKLIHYLWADRMHTTLVDAASSSECQQLSSYAARFHSNNFGTSSAVCHGAMDHFYDKLTIKPFTSTYPNDIISAALFIADTFNTALTDPSEWLKSVKKISESDLLDHMQDAGLWLETIYSSMKSGLQINDVIFNLGK